MASRSGGKLLGLKHVVCEVQGKVKKIDVSLPSQDFKEGKMIVYRLGNSSSFSIGIQTGPRKFVSPINLKSHQFELHLRPKRLTISFKNSTSRLSILDANEDELKTFVDQLENINYSTNQDKKTPLRQTVTPSIFSHEDYHVNDENHPLNAFTGSRSHSSSETNQFLSTKSTHESSRLNTPSQIHTKRKNTPFSTGGSSSFYGQGRSNSPDTLKRSALSPKKDRSPYSIAKRNANTSSGSSFYGSNSSPLQRKKIPVVGLSKDFKKKSHLSNFSFKSSAQPSFTDDFQLTGFSNIGNTCYMNAILQSLLGIQPFIQDLCNKSLLVNNPPQSLYKCTYGLLLCKKKNCRQDLQNLHLRKFKRAISHAATRFSGHLQHDAHEFLCQVLDQLKDEVVDLNKKATTDSGSKCSPKDLTLSCPVTRTFECAVFHTITCKGCGENLTKEEILHDLSLDLPSISNDTTTHAMKGIAIDKLIEDYFKDEELEYCCEECGCKEASISHKFSKLPRVLILHVKRYDFNMLTDRHAKKHNNVNIKKFIDIGKLCTSKTSVPLPFEVKNINLMEVRAPAKTDMIEAGDESSISISPKVRRQLQQEFDTTPRRKKRVYTMDSDDEGTPSQQKQMENVQITVKNTSSTKSGVSERKVQITSNAIIDSLVEDFNEIDETPLVIESASDDATNGELSLPEEASDDATNGVLSLPEDEQLQWALNESMKASKDLDSVKNTRSSTLEGMEVEYDMDFTDDEILSALGGDSYQQQTVGLKGGARSDIDQTTQSDDSENSGYMSPPKKKPFTIFNVCNDSTDTSVDEDGVPKPKKDNSLCSIIDKQPVLNEFVDDLLIEVDTKKGSAKLLSTSPKRDKFIKSCTSSFNAKYHPVVSKTQSATKPVRTPSPRIAYSTNRSKHLSKSTQALKARKSLYTQEKQTVPSDYEDDISLAIRKSLEDQQVSNDDDEQMRRAIELSIQETKIAYAAEEDALTIKNYLSDESPQKTIQNDSVDSGFQGDETVSFPYRLVSVVSHLGNKSSSGHYISDVYDGSKDEWTSYDDLTAMKVDEHKVRYGHSRDGYIFFYMYKPCVDTVQQSTSITN